MNHTLNNVFTFDDEHETLLDWSIRTELPDDDHPAPPIPVTDANPLTQNNSLRWRPTPKLQRLYDRFQNNLLGQWPRIACIYCGKLLYPEKASWVFYDSST